MAQGAPVAVNASANAKPSRVCRDVTGFGARHNACSVPHPCDASFPGPWVSWCSRARCSCPRAQMRASELNLRAKVAPRATPAAACKASVRACRTGASNGARLHASSSPHAATRRLLRGQRARGSPLARDARSTRVRPLPQTAARRTPKREVIPTAASMRGPRPAPASERSAPDRAAPPPATIRIHPPGPRALRLPPPLLHPLPPPALPRATAAVLRASPDRVTCRPSGSPSPPAQPSLRSADVAGRQFKTRKRGA